MIGMLDFSVGLQTSRLRFDVWWMLGAVKILRAATHLPCCAGHHRVHTAKAGGAEACPPHFFYHFVNIFGRFQYISIFLLATQIALGYNVRVYAMYRHIITYANERI